MNNIAPIRRDRVISWFGPYTPLEARAILDATTHGSDWERFDAILLEAMTEGWTSQELGYAIASLFEEIGEQQARGARG